MANKIESLKNRAEALMDKYTDFSCNLSPLNPLSKFKFQAEQPKFEMQAKILYREFQSINLSTLSPDEREMYAELDSIMQDLLETIFE